MNSRIINYSILIALFIGALNIFGQKHPTSKNASNKVPSTKPHVKVNYKIGILLDDFNSSRWTLDSFHLADQIRKLGHTPIIRYCDSDTALQRKQASELVDLGAKVLIIVCADSKAAASIVFESNAKKIPVIAYDRIIMNAPVSCFITYDGKTVGEMQGQYVLKKLKNNGRIVLLHGPSGDRNAELIKEGQLSVLKPYIDSGRIRIVYQKTLKEWTSMEGMMETTDLLVKEHINVDAILAANDCIAEGVAEAFMSLRPDERVILTGQDACLVNCQLIKDGIQSMTIFKSAILQAQKAVSIAVSLAENPNYKIIAPKIQHNGYSEIPTFELTPKIIDESNVQKEIFDSGYYPK